jgi:hypothetical protein
MSQANAQIHIDFWIPGVWKHPAELLQALPPECRLSEQGLVMSDGTKAEFNLSPADGQFAKIFRLSLRNEARAEELANLDRYTLNFLLSGPGGSMEAAHAMMRAVAAIVQAGGAGVFIGNSGVAHGGQAWLELTADGGPDALSFAYVGIIQGPDEIWTMGLHVLGLPDISMNRADVEDSGFEIVEVVRYVCRSEHTIEDGHIIADLDSPRFQVRALADDKRFKPEAMRNPFGILRLVSFRDIAETN